MQLLGTVQMAKFPSCFGIGKLQTSAAGTFNLPLPCFLSFSSELFWCSVVSYGNKHAPIEVWGSVKSLMSVHHDTVDCAMQQLEHSDSLPWNLHVVLRVLYKVVTHGTYHSSQALSLGAVTWGAKMHPTE